MTNKYPMFLIDPPSPFASLHELVDFRKRCLEVLEQYPGHEQWRHELEEVERAIAVRQREGQ